MKYRYLLTALFFVHIAGFSQETERSEQERDTLAINDSLVIAREDSMFVQGDSLNIMIDGKPIVFRDNAVFKLNDRPDARKLDSLWLKDYYDSGLFDTLYTDISTMEFEKVSNVDLPTDTLKARLAKLNQKTPFNIEYNPGLESVINSFLKYRRKHLTKLMALSKFYFPLFEQELDNYDIPLEVKYLAIVESALNPRAKSRVGATGLWQFMFGTGKVYGLDVSSYVDERSDPVKSTTAASKYLARLYKIFGDWDLALAAYNSGPGNVTKAIRRSGGYENYWNLRPFLPRETAGYVPAFLATMYIFEYAEEHGFEKVNPKAAYFQTDTVRIKKVITFDQISELLNISVEEVQFFNPSYKLDIIPYVEDENYTLRLEVSDIGRFVANEQAIYTYVEQELAKREKPLPELLETESKIRYKVQSGDYLGRIASKFGVRVSEIKRWNGMRNNNIRAGERLTIYPRKPGMQAPVKKASASTYTGDQKQYEVQEGDSLWSIAKKFPGISVENIKEWNDIRGDNLKPGLKLKLCKC
ncbi:LysM peptidoglycan-binding domain-containing protein [Robertkochia solimangrovi]|uniref:LysM peptidoglycan-binding domain-containing protein n=1 Tax=Robertkochia solimangrovi TaxID=2213046 RepID=UPI00117C7AC5|nr:LysM peptidoglycan-binding domain-containing protein [Robertkochia solimangrovi]TRZ46044.1 lytic transglycosylase [Robertkochia solimangrovi]